MQRTDIERLEANLNIAAVQVEQNRLEEAEASLRTAPELQPSFVQADMNLADL